MVLYGLRITTLACLIIFISALSSVSFAGDKVSVDNWDIQRFRGRLGLWKLIESKNHLRFTLKKFKSTYKDFYALNGRKFGYNSYLFIP